MNCLKLYFNKYAILGEDAMYLVCILVSQKKSTIFIYLKLAQNICTENAKHLNRKCLKMQK